MSSASLTLGASVGGAFALLLVVMVIAFCIYMYRHPERRKTIKVNPANKDKPNEKSNEIKARKGNKCCCFWDQFPSDTVPPPDPPVKLELRNLQSNDVTISWKPPVADAASRIDSYIIYLRPSAESNNWRKITKVKSNITEKLVQKLESSERYVLGVASKNKGGESPIIETKSFILAKEREPPSKPTGPIKYNITHNSITLSWKHPKDIGSRPVSGYIIEVLDKQKDNWREVGITAENVTTFCLQNLEVDTEVWFRVIARNDIGNSAPLVGAKVMTKLQEKLPLGRKPNSSRSRYTHSSCSSNTKLTKSALQKILKHWETANLQMAPTATNSAFSKSPKLEITEMMTTSDTKVSQRETDSNSALRAEPRLDTHDER